MEIALLQPSLQFASQGRRYLK